MAAERVGSAVGQMVPPACPQTLAGGIPVYRLGISRPLKSPHASFAGDEGVGVIVTLAPASDSLGAGSSPRLRRASSRATESGLIRAPVAGGDATTGPRMATDPWTPH